MPVLDDLAGIEDGIEQGTRKGEAKLLHRLNMRQLAASTPSRFKDGPAPATRSHVA